MEFPPALVSSWYRPPPPMAEKNPHHAEACSRYIQRAQYVFLHWGGGVGWGAQTRRFRTALQGHKTRVFPFEETRQLCSTCSSKTRSVMGDT